MYNFRKNYNLLNSFLTNIPSSELLDDFVSLLINTTNASAFSTLRKYRVLNTPSFKWWNNSLRIQRKKNISAEYIQAEGGFSHYAWHVGRRDCLHVLQQLFGKLTSPTNLRQILTGDPAFLFHSKISLLLDSHFPSGSSRIPLVLNDCSPPSCLSPSEVEVVFRKLRGGKAPDIDLIDCAIWKALYNSFPNLLFRFFKLHPI
ncbi:hypothetical protein TNCV_470061 [Trichonephila clavipes]|nr:hypothetical protein TNCV_470061 [Trichonephila clavipes]